MGTLVIVKLGVGGFAHSNFTKSPRPSDSYTGRKAPLPIEPRLAQNPQIDELGAGRGAPSLPSSTMGMRDVGTLVKRG